MSPLTLFLYLVAIGGGLALWAILAFFGLMLVTWIKSDSPSRPKPPKARLNWIGILTIASLSSSLTWIACLLLGNR